MSVARARLVVPAPSRRHSMCSARCTFVVQSLIRQQQKNTKSPSSSPTHLETELERDEYVYDVRSTVLFDHGPVLTDYNVSLYPSNNNDNNKDSDIDCLFPYSVHSCSHYLNVC